MFSYNITRHEATGFTPHELIFGKKARLPSEFAKQKIPLSYNLFIKTLAEKITETQATCKEKLEIAKERSKQYYDQKLNSQNYNEGDLVYLQRNDKTSKLESNYKGPFKINKVFDDGNVEIEMKRGKTKIVHTNLLRPQTLKIF